MKSVGFKNIHFALQSQASKIRGRPRRKLVRPGQCRPTRHVEEILHQRVPAPEPGARLRPLRFRLPDEVREQPGGSAARPSAAPRTPASLGACGRFGAPRSRGGAGRCGRSRVQLCVRPRSGVSPKRACTLMASGRSAGAEEAPCGVWLARTHKDL